MEQNSITIHDKKFKVYMNRDEIHQAVLQVSEVINREMREKNPLIIVVLKGAFMFASDLMREMDFPCEIAFVRLSSYAGTNTTGTVIESIGLSENIEGRTILVIEDIVDSGTTMFYFINRLRQLQPKEIKLATFFFKPNALRTNVTIDYCAKEIPNDFVVGYGLDYDQQGRNLRDIYVLDSSNRM